MKLSLILATVGRSDDVQRFVESIIGQTSRTFELIVVDQNQDERLLPSIQLARAAGLDVQHLRMAQASLSGARNLGLQHASGDVIAFPDDDCWYEPDAVAAVCTAFAQQPAWSGVVAQWVEQTAARGGEPAQGELSPAAWRRYRGGDASSISLFIRAAVFKQLGGFDERLGVGRWFGAGEEIDLIFRALAAGAVLGRCPNARVHHRFWGHMVDQPGITGRAVFKRARGTGALYAKHRLPTVVVLRGLVAPPLVAVAHRQGIKGLWLALAMSAGRIQGVLAWALFEV